jgi:hypothetical protein
MATRIVVTQRHSAIDIIALKLKEMGAPQQLGMSFA